MEHRRSVQHARGSRSMLEHRRGRIPHHRTPKRWRRPVLGSQLVRPVLRARRSRSVLKRRGGVDAHHRTPKRWRRPMLGIQRLRPVQPARGSRNMLKCRGGLLPHHRNRRTTTTRYRWRWTPRLDRQLPHHLQSVASRLQQQRRWRRV